jgi:hypothetical protein
MFQPGDLVIREFHTGLIGNIRPRPYYAVVVETRDGMVYGQYAYSPDDAFALAAKPCRFEMLGCLQENNLRLYQPVKPLQETIMRGKRADIHIFAYDQ